MREVRPNEGSNLCSERGQALLKILKSFKAVEMKRKWKDSPSGAAMYQRNFLGPNTPQRVFRLRLMQRIEVLLRSDRCW